MVYLITGGCGFIGSHLAEELVSEGNSVRIYDNLSSGYEKNIATIRNKVEFIKADVRDLSAINSAMSGVDNVFHGAALVSVFDSVKRPYDNHDINLTGTLNVLTAARDNGVKRLVFASSAAVYGNNPELPKREDMKPEPESPYGLAKVAAEHYLAVFAKLYGLETVGLRFFNVYGPRQDPGSLYSGVTSRFVKAVMDGDSPSVFGDGKQTRDFIFVDDVVRACILAMYSTGIGKGDVFNIGSGFQTSLLDLLKVLKEFVGKSFDIEFYEPRTGDLKHSCADITLAEQKLQFSPKHDIRAGLKKLLDYIV
ncbi:MAG: SDR family oxidoreductase [Desulfobacteraceae bacterium]|nr:MAG: SDR family oxidoreductase [Desulfobacteraceae bacterium]